MNPLHLCGECSESGLICCDTVNETANCSGVCGLRPVFSVQPHGAPALDVEFPRQSPIEGGDSIVFLLNNANPSRMELTTWTVGGDYCCCMYNSLTISIYIYSNEINAHTLFCFISCCDC